MLIVHRSQNTERIFLFGIDDFFVTLSFALKLTVQTGTILLTEHVL